MQAPNVAGWSSGALRSVSFSVFSLVSIASSSAPSGLHQDARTQPQAFEARKEPDFHLS